MVHSTISLHRRCRIRPRHTTIMAADREEHLACPHLKTHIASFEESEA